MPTHFDTRRTCTWSARSFIETTEEGEVCYACKRPAATREESDTYFGDRLRTTGRGHEQNAANWTTYQSS